MSSSAALSVTIFVCIVLLKNQAHASGCAKRAKDFDFQFSHKDNSVVEWSPKKDSKFDFNYTNFNVRFADGVPGIWKTPMTIEQAKKEGWELVHYHEEFTLIAVWCSKNDPRACGMYDIYGELCGFRLAYIYKLLSKKCDISKYYRYDKIQAYKNRTTYNDFIWYSDFIFSPPADLKNGGPKHKKNKLGDGVWFQPYGDKWVQVPPYEKDVLTGLPGIVRHGCLAGMGNHYFYVSREVPCACAYPFFAMYHEGYLVAIGMVAFGSVNQYEGAKKPRMWYEETPVWFPSTVFISRPSCLVDYIIKCGAIGLHMYMTPHPEQITCPNPVKTTHWE